jgi:hypothetical protein
MSAPLLEYSRLARPHAWWLRQAPPPWLDDPRWQARAFRASLLLGLMGTVSGWLTVAGFVGAAFVSELLGGFEEALQFVFGLFCGPGFWFGVGVLMPLSRWLGRGWILSLLSVPLSMLACYCGVVTFLTIDPIMGPGPAWIPGGERAGGFSAGFVGAAIVGLWMGHPRRKSAWLAVGLATFLAALGCGAIFLPGNDPSPPVWMVPEITQWIRFGAPYVTFQSLAAIGLGARLWWGESASAAMSLGGDEVRQATSSPGQVRGDEG